MKTYLLTWNPQKWKWDTISLDSAIKDLKNSGVYLDSWSCGVNKSIEKGDRLFLIRLGSKTKGICASGFATSNVYKGPHWNGVNGQFANYISIEYDVLLNPVNDKILNLDVLKTAITHDQFWTPAASGIIINQAAAEELEKVWFNFIGENYNFKINEQKQFDSAFENQKFEEGDTKQITSTKYERNPYARKACIDKYKSICFVCKFDFTNYYGDIGIDFIHVHHLTPVSSREGIYKIDPEIDLIPVCPNCHAMIHRRKPELTIDELKEIVLKSRYQIQG
jgi:5-methylcytosine-specific restriction protein A